MLISHTQKIFPLPWLTFRLHAMPMFVSQWRGARHRGEERDILFFRRNILMVPFMRRFQSSPTWKRRVSCVSSQRGEKEAGPRHLLHHEHLEQLGSSKHLQKGRRDKRVDEEASGWKVHGSKLNLFFLCNCSSCGSSYALALLWTDAISSSSSRVAAQVYAKEIAAYTVIETSTQLLEGFERRLREKTRGLLVFMRVPHPVHPHPDPSSGPVGAAPTFTVNQTPTLLLTAVPTD